MSDFIPALPFSASAKLYDFVLKWTFPERQIKARIVEVLDPKEGELVLDVGCGTGTLLEFIARRQPNVRLLGTDISSSMVSTAKLKLNRFQGIIIVVANITSLPLRNESVDAIACTLMMHHLHSSEKVLALQEIIRVLKPGGRFVVCDFGHPSSALMRLCFGFIRVVDGFSNTADNVEGNIPRLLTSGGFRLVAEAAVANTVYGTVRTYMASKSVARYPLPTP